MTNNISGYATKDKPWLQYYEEGAFEKAINAPTNSTVWDFVEKSFADHIDVPAIEYFKKEISRPDFMISVYTWAKTFKAMGVEPNEIVPIYGPFFPDICAMTFALNAIGSTSYFLKLAISKEALQEETKDSKVAVVYDGMWKNVRDVFDTDRFKKIIVASAADSMLHPQKEIVRFANYIEARRNKTGIPNTSKYVTIDEAKKIANYYTGKVKEDYVPNRSAFITSSSGTTGKTIKGTEITNESVIAQLNNDLNAKLNYNAGKRCLTNLPPTASTSLNCFFLYPLIKGMTIINEPRLSENTYYNQLINYRPEVTLMTGSVWTAFARQLEMNYYAGRKQDLSFLEMPILGGEGLTPEALNWVNDLLFKNNSKVPLFNGYGMSEVFSVASVEIQGKQIDDIDKTKSVNSVGVPFPGITVGVFDENGKELGYNERGELWIQTKAAMKGYYNKPELSQETIVDGYVHSGDIFEIDENGILYLYGRKTDSIIYDGETIYLFDVANKIRDDKDIKTCIVNKIPTESGDTMVAHVVFENEFKGKKEEVYERINKTLESYLPIGLQVTGYKQHKNDFPTSPTTAKKDRDALMKDLSNYRTVVDGVEYKIDFERIPETNYYEVLYEEIKKDQYAWNVYNNRLVKMR